MCVLVCCSHISLSGEVKVVFRFDDYAENSETHKELKIIDAFRAAEVPVTFGVIPFSCVSNYKVPHPRQVIPLQGEKANILKKAYGEGIMEIALHGYNHQTWFSSHLSEFNDVGYIKQKELIAKGKAHLEKVVGVSVETFVPPWNSYDLNTVNVLEELGFKTLSASFGGEAETTQQINMIPWTCGLRDVKDAVEMARDSGHEHSLIVAVFHLADMSWGEENASQFSIHELPGLLGWLKAQPDVCVVSLSEVSSQMGARGVSWYLGNNLRLKLDQFLPAFLKKKSTTFLNFEGGRYSGDILIFVFVFMVCIIASAIVGYSLFRRMRNC